MRIESPIIGLARTSLSRTAHAIERSLARLSSGRAVNSPRDNAADYSLGVTLESQVRGIRQGTLNANSAQASLMTTESVLQSQIDLTQRMRELAVQASSGLLSVSDRENLNTELQSLLSEFGRLGQSIESLHTRIQIGANAGETLDFVIPDLSSENQITRTVGTGRFDFSSSNADSTTSPRGVETGDLNNDGHEDFVLSDEPFTAYLGDGQGNFELSQVLDDGELGIDSLDLGDFNDDGILDIVGATVSGVTKIWFGRGDGTFNSPQCVGSFSTTNVEAADFNGDGHLDVLSHTGEVANIAYNDGHGVFSEHQTFGTKSGAAVEVADLNGDGVSEVLAFDTQLRVYTRNSDNSWTETSHGAIDSVAVGHAVGDLNNDGLLDVAIAASGSFGTLAMFFGEGDGSFTRAATITSTGFVDPYGLDIGDINGDYLNDLLVVDPSLSRALSYLGTGGGQFSSAIRMEITSPNPFGISLADFNEDSALDYVSGDRGGGYSIYMGRTEERSGLIDLDLRSQTKSQVAIDVLDTTLQNLQNELTQIGTLHNRLDSAISSNLLLSESLEEARSKAIDTDIAQETAELVRNQILQQAQVAVLAQANSQMSIVLNLLRQ